MIKVLKIVRAIPGIPDAGGAENVCWEIAKSHKEKGLDVELLIPFNGNTFSKENIKINTFPKIKPYSTTYKYFSKILLPKFEKQWDISHFHIASPLPNIFLDKKKFGKMVITCHGGDIFPKKTGHDFDNLKYIFSQVDAVTCPSKWLCNYLFRNYGVKSYFVPNGVDTNKFKKLANVSKEKNTILYFGRIHHRKGILNLLEATKELPNFKFKFIGSGPLVDTIDGKNIEYLGFVDDLVTEINKAELCIFPSYWENAPLVGLEAMACGTPIIATKLGFSEIIDNEKTGFILNDNNPKTIIEKIKDVASDKSKLEDMGNLSIEKVMENYTWSKISEKYNNIYNIL